MLFGISGCEWPLAIGACSDSVEPGIIVEIRDAHTGIPLAGLARGVVRDGAFVDSLRPHSFLRSDDIEGSMLSRSAANERAGEYTVEIQRHGYRRWIATDVRVRRGGCHVKTRQIRAALVPVA